MSKIPNYYKKRDINSHVSRPIGKKDITSDKEFDYIIIGGGTAGSALTYKLNKLKPNLRLLVIESGQDDQRYADTVPGLAVPGKSQQEYFPGTFPITPTAPNGDVWVRYMTGGPADIVRAESDGLHVWNDYIQYQKSALISDEVKVSYSFSSSFGGSSTHNSGVWLRPSKFYFAYLKSLGLKKFTYEESVEIFKEIEYRGKFSVGPYGDGSEGPYNPANSKRFFDPNAPPTQGVVSDIGFDPKTMGDKGRLIIGQPNYEDPNYKSLTAVFEQINTEQPDRFGIHVNTNQSVYPEIVSFEPTTLIFNATAPDVLYEKIGGLIRVSLMPGLPDDYTTRSYLTRTHAGNTYLIAAQKSQNVTIFSNTFVTKILLDHCNRAIGVEYIKGRNVYRSGRNNLADWVHSQYFDIASREAAFQNSKEALRDKKRVFCNYEVILSAGFAHTPLILEHSGIGNPNIIGQFGIETKLNLPGVGENLSDHVAIVPVFKGFQSSIMPYLTAGLFPASKFLGNFRFNTDPAYKRYDVLGISILATDAGVSPGTAYQLQSDLADVLFRQQNSSAFDPRDGTSMLPYPEIPAVPGFVLIGQMLYPESRGYTHIRSSNPTDTPTTVINGLAKQADIDRFIQGFRFLVEIAERSRGTTYVEENPAGPPFVNVPATSTSQQMFQDYYQPKYEEFTDDTFQFKGSVSQVIDPVTFVFGPFDFGHAYLTEQISGYYMEMESGQAAGQRRLILHWDRDNLVAKIAAPFNAPISAGDRFGIRRMNPTKIVNIMSKRIYLTWHTCGSCKMGLKTDPTAVVDQSQRVFGIKGLRIADNSIYPVVPDVNTQTAAYLAGWRLAKIISKNIDDLCNK